MNGKDEEFVTPQRYVQYVAKHRRITISDFDVAPVVVLTWQPRLLNELVRRTGAKRSRQWLYGDEHPLYTGGVTGQRISFVRVPIGAAGTVVHMEELIACGARCIVGLGHAGSLQPTVPVGTLFIPTFCFSEEGVSEHYRRDGVQKTTPSDHLVQLLQASCRAEQAHMVEGTICSTDAPYRETKTKIQRLIKNSTLGIDMETSAMTVVGWFRGVETCNILVISDELGMEEWRPLFDTPKVLDGENLAIRAVLHWASHYARESC